MAALKKIFITSFYGEGLAIGYQLQREGVKVYASIIADINDTVTQWEKKKTEDQENKKKRLSLFDGIIEKQPIDGWVDFVSKNADSNSFILNDFNSTWKYAEQLSTLGIVGIYPTEDDRRLEIDRAFAKDFIKKHYPEVEIAEEHEFKKVTDAIKFVEGSSDSFCIKGNNDDAPTFVPDTDDEEAANLSTVNKLNDEKTIYEKGGFILEKRIKNCKELSPQAWFVNGEMVATSLDIELKRIGAGDIGFMTGCAADLVFETPIDSEINKVAFPPIVKKMAKDHPGVFIWDLSLLYDPETGTAYGSEFCPARPGYNAFFTELAHQEEKKVFFERLMSGQSPYEDKSAKFGASIRIFNFKSSGGDMSVPEGKRIELTGETEQNCWPMDVKEGKEGMESIGWDYQLAVVTGTGDTIKQAAKEAYKAVAGFGFVDKVNRPMEDYLSTKYPSSIVNRYDWGSREGLW